LPNKIYEQGPLLATALLVANTETGYADFTIRLGNQGKKKMEVNVDNMQLALPSGSRNSILQQGHQPYIIDPGDTLSITFPYWPVNHLAWFNLTGYRGDFPPFYTIDLSFISIDGAPLAGASMQLDAVSWEKYAREQGREKDMKLWLPAPDSLFDQNMQRCVKALLPKQASMPAPSLQLRPEELSVGGVVARVAVYSTADSLYALLRVSNQNDQLLLVNQSEFQLLHADGSILPFQSMQVQTPHQYDEQKRMIIRKGERFHALFSYNKEDIQPQQFGLSGLLLAGPDKPVFCTPIPLQSIQP
jgi:hypothetical protein